MIKQEAEFQEKLNETKRQLELDYEDKIASLKEKHKTEIEGVETRYKDLIKNLEDELKASKELKYAKDETLATIDDLKLEIQVIVFLNTFNIY